MPDLSILIPSRNEPYLNQTIKDIFENSKADIEVLVGLDGYDEDIEGRNNLTVLKLKENIGQRAITNELARMARGKYLMKLDAHCSMGYGFDRIMLNDIEDDMILAPYMLVLDADTWTVRNDKRTSQYCFDSNMVMQYQTELERPEMLTETMCLQGSCFMMTKQLYFDLNICDESLGSWGSQAVELGCKAWLSGNRCVTTKNTYYAHLFRTTDADFPYDRGENPGKKSNELITQMYKNEKIAWLIEKFGYPADWTPEKVIRLPRLTNVL